MKIKSSYYISSLLIFCGVQHFETYYCWSLDHVWCINPEAEFGVSRRISRFALDQVVVLVTEVVCGAPFIVHCFGSPVSDPYGFSYPSWIAFNFAFQDFGPLPVYDMICWSYVGPEIADLCDSEMDVSPGLNFVWDFLCFFVVFFEVCTAKKQRKSQTKFKPGLPDSHPRLNLPQEVCGIKCSNRK